MNAAAPTCRSVCRMASNKYGHGKRGRDDFDPTSSSRHAPVELDDEFGGSRRGRWSFVPNPGATFMTNASLRARPAGRRGPSRRRELPSPGSRSTPDFGTQCVGDHVEFRISIQAIDERLNQRTVVRPPNGLHADFKRLCAWHLPYGRALSGSGSTVRR